MAAMPGRYNYTYSGTGDYNHEPDNFICSSAPDLFIVTNHLGGSCSVNSLYGRSYYPYWIYNLGFRTLKEATEHMTKIESQDQCLRLRDQYQCPKFVRQRKFRRQSREKRKTYLKKRHRGLSF